MKRWSGALILALISLIVPFSPASAAAKKKLTRIKVVVLDFEEQGQIQRGSGSALAVILSQAINFRRYFVMDPQRLKPILRKHRWFKKYELTEELLKDLKKLGVKLILTGTVFRQYKNFMVNYRIVSTEGRILFSELLPSVSSWPALISTLKYSVKFVLKKGKSSRASSTARARRFSSLRSRLKKLLKKGKKKKRSKLKSFAEVVKGFKKYTGLFTLYAKREETGDLKIYMEISPKQLGRLFLFAPALEGGTGEFSLITFATLPEFVFYFQRAGSQLWMLEKNVLYRANPKKAVYRALTRSFADTLRASVKIISAPHPKTKAFLVDFKALFLRDYVQLSYWQFRGGRFFRKPLRFDARKSRFGNIRTYPKNIEIEINAFYNKVGKIMNWLGGNQMKLKLRYSLSTLPGPGYKPRLADDRVGHFYVMAKDFSRDDVDTRYVRYITRWRLEKKYPHKLLSPPKKPIVFWLENTIPKQYRKAVAQGVLLWNRAFRRLGFQNAILVKQQPDKSNWDGADVRYSTIRWFLADNAGFAQGPSRVNPITGEIFDADIRVSADMLLFLSQYHRWVVSPLQKWGGINWEYWFNPNAKWEFDRAVQRLFSLYKKEASKLLTPPNLPPRLRKCNYARGLSLQAAFGWNVLKMRGLLKTKAQEREFINQFLISVISHEVGHTLGLRHNFKASTLHRFENLHNPKLTKYFGLTNSVMEYTPVNLALPGQKQGEYFQTSLGPYDYWAIEYAYKPLPKTKTPADEKPYLEKIASRAADPRLAYATDEDAFGFADPFSVDPTATRWDLGREPLKFYRARVQMSRELWNRLEEKLEKPQYSYQIMRRTFLTAASIYLRSGLQASKYLGGLYHRRDHIGDPGRRRPFEPVPAKKQREALQFLIENFFSPGNFQWPESLLNKLAPNRYWTFDFSIFRSRIDLPVHQMVLFLQLFPLLRVLHPAVLDRIQDTYYRLPKKERAEYLSISELFSSLTGAIWSELFNQKRGPSTKPAKGVKADLKIDSFRRSLQWFHLNLMGIYYRAVYLGIPDAQSLARRELLKLAERLVFSIPRAADAETKAHLQRSLQRIKQLFKATVITW